MGKWLNFFVRFVFMCREWMGKLLCSISLWMLSVLSLLCRSFEVFGVKILNVKLCDWEVGD